MAPSVCQQQKRLTNLFGFDIRILWNLPNWSACAGEDFTMRLGTVSDVEGVKANLLMKLMNLKCLWNLVTPKVFTLPI